MPDTRKHVFFRHHPRGLKPAAVLLACSLLLPACQRGCRGCKEEKPGLLRTGYETASTSAGAFPVVKIVDGDTMWVKTDKGKEKIRLLNIDTPEITGQRKHPFGFEAKTFIKKMLKNKKVYLRKDPEQEDRDKFGRLLRYVLTDKRLNINVEIVRSGWSAYYTKYGSSALYHLEFLKAEKEARKPKKGIWQNPIFLSGGYLKNARGLKGM